MEIKRVIILVLDSVGAGEAEDAIEYGDWGANTLLHTLQYNPDIQLPNLEKLGLRGVIFNEDGNYIGSYGRLRENSKGKDSISGHWEMAGVILKKAFPTYPNGFPKNVIEKFERLTGKKALGNKPASGTEIIKEYYEEHRRTGNPIVYTSADSVFQIAAHKDVIPLDELYRMCEIARYEVCVGEHEVARVIARPFIGTPETGFVRTSERRDYAVKPPNKTVLDLVKEKGLNVVGIGKIHDLFAGVGLTESIHTENNIDGLEKTIQEISKDYNGIIFTNLVEFDANWGHRRDFKAYGKGLKDVDDRLPQIINTMKPYDMLIITADHGCDPTFKAHTDHTREFTPLIVYGEHIRPNINLGLRQSISDISATISEIFNVERINGTSFINLIYK
ncbi:phosphopentomutase [Caldisericum exile]|uniref:Phosphopentomutase n=1 Tax=Caldisericum exile (strain DSM 21853 / NBRC 104410 / AZM16c01) TaxID=511051 RepID=A0A7U6GEH0_CALEA|nr:phosphopentomutase [Caldisericum exile]BAL80896.1 phosphopentomutase [Caldisericum exile AZM16c01]